ncbi:MAG: tryptophan--tRNA ligase, partial [Chloroflexi bacterium]|nr:tryptophan--tRNA ligase [Chloroflexota bacterium]
MEKKGRILTGHRPTGPRHLGHLVGTLETWAQLQDDYECYFLIADWHVLTTDVEHTAQIGNNIQEMLFDWLAAGLDPERSVFVQQSLVKEHAELALLLGNLVTVSRLRRNPTFKEQVQELHLGDRASMGLLAYPVLQAADILVYKADTVPVGEDQVPHLELSREIARKFNTTFKPIFPEPKPYLSAIPRLPGLDNRKMGSSYQNF